MKKAIKYMIYICIYLSSSYYGYKYDQQWHSCRGQCANCDFGIMDLFFNFMPGVNTLIVVFEFFDNPDTDGMWPYAINKNTFNKIYNKKQ